MSKGGFVKALQKHVVNPVAKPFAGRAFGVALLETMGRKSGRPRQNPVTDGLRGDTFWIIAEHGRGAGYVRNIEAHPRVRIRTHGRWRTGSAKILWDDDPLARQEAVGLKGLNSWMVRRVGTELVTVRVDLDPA